MLALIGDLHTDRHAASNALYQIADDPRITRVVQVGDLNFLPGFARGERFLDEVNAVAAECGFVLEFIDGNHDNHEGLALLERDEMGRGVVREHIRHLPRGFRFELDDVSFLAFGGAVSVNRWMLTEGEDWWPGEVPTYREYHDAIEAGPADVIIAHERCITGPVRPNSMYIPPEVQADANANVRSMMSLARAVGASTYIHGHHHIRYHDEIDGLRIEGLGMNGASINELVGVFDDVTRHLRKPVAREVS